MKTTWAEVIQGKQWERIDKAMVLETGLYAFEAIEPCGIKLKTKRGKVRSWTSAPAAMRALDKEIPIEVLHNEKIKEEDPVEYQEDPRPENLPIPGIHHRPLPEDWTPPSYMDCGHLSWNLQEDTCEGCEQKHPPSWRHLKGSFIRPVPVSARRTKLKEATGGFPGLCCNSEGIYIGGDFNDCRRTGTERCEVHQPH